MRQPADGVSPACAIRPGPLGGDGRCTGDHRGRVLAVRGQVLGAGRVNALTVNPEDIPPHKAACCLTDRPRLRRYHAGASCRYAYGEEDADVGT